MTQRPESLEALGTQIARDVETQRDIEEFLGRKRHWFAPVFSLGLAFFPGALVIVVSEMSFPSRAIVAVAVAAAFGLVIEYLWLERRLNAAIKLLLIVSRKNER